MDFCFQRAERSPLSHSSCSVQPRILGITHKRNTSRLGDVQGETGQRPRGWGATLVFPWVFPFSLLSPRQGAEQANSQQRQILRSHSKKAWSLYSQDQEGASPARQKTYTELLYSRQTLQEKLTPGLTLLRPAKDGWEPGPPPFWGSNEVSPNTSRVLSQRPGTGRGPSFLWASSEPSLPPLHGRGTTVTGGRGHRSQGSYPNSAAQAAAPPPGCQTLRRQPGLPPLPGSRRQHLGAEMS